MVILIYRLNYFIIHLKMPINQRFKSLPLLLIGFLLIYGAAASIVNAESTSFQASPTNFIIMENDLGQKMPITITNPGTTDLTFTAVECLAERVNGEMVISDNVISKSSIDIENSEIKVKAGETGTLNTRVRISANGEELIPCVLISEKPATAGAEVQSTPVLVTYIIQNFTGELNASITIDIGTSGVVTSPDMVINGTINNTGEKFFIPTGKLIISKDGAVLSETDLSGQISSRMMPGNTKTFQVTWTNTLDTFGSLGDYQIEVRITNDQTSKVSIGQLMFTYVSSDLIILVTIAGIAILAIIGGLVILKRR